MMGVAKNFNTDECKIWWLTENGKALCIHGSETAMHRF
jgi:hypothetical protein